MMTPKEAKKVAQLEERVRKSIEDTNYWRKRYEDLSSKVVYEHQEWRALLRSLVTNAIGS